MNEKEDADQAHFRNPLQGSRKGHSRSEPNQIRTIAAFQILYADCSF